MINIEEINILKDKAKKPWPFRGFEQKVYSANFLLVLSGILLSFYFRNWQYFERIGSLMVIYGIYIAWRDMSGRLDWFDTMTKNTIKKEISALNNRKSTGIISSAINDATEKKLESLSKANSELFNLIKIRLRTIEALTLAMGTFIWGFGCIIGSLFYKFNA